MNYFWATSPADKSRKDQSTAPWTFLQTEGRSRPSISPVLIFSVVFVSTSIVPYILVRNRLGDLHRHVGDLRSANVALARELRAAMAEVNKGRTEFSSASTRTLLLLNNNKQLLAETHATLKEHSAALADCKATLDGHRATWAGWTAILKENKVALERVQSRLNDVDIKLKLKGDAVVRAEVAQLQNRLTQLATTVKSKAWAMKKWQEGMSKSIAAEGDRQRTDAEWKKALARSLADLATFMQEVEIREGWTPRPDDGRGIERLRSLAKRLENLALLVESLQAESRLNIDILNNSTQPPVNAEEVGETEAEDRVLG